MRSVWAKPTIPRTRRIYRLRRNARGSLTNQQCPHHIMQRRPDGKALFERDPDFRMYLSTLRTLRKTLMLKVYRYCLMTNHVHLIVDPGGETGSLRSLMASLSEVHAPHLERSGPSWEKCVLFVPIESDRYLSACTRYVDFNPVEAGIVTRPQDYLWSSYAAMTGRRSCPWLDPDPCFLALGVDTAQRQQRYRELVELANPPDILGFAKMTMLYDKKINQTLK